VDAGVDALSAEATRILGVRQRDLSEQALELQGLRGKNVSVIKHMRVRIEQEQDEFENSNGRILALRSVQGKLLREVYSVLGTTALRNDMGKLAASLKRPGIKLNVRKIYGETFDALRNNLKEVQTTTGEIQSMLHATFRQLNAEHGFTLKAPAEPDLVGFQQQLSDIEKSHVHYLGMGNMLKLAQPDFCDKLVRALASRLRVVNEAAMTEVERWSKGAAAQLDAQLKERRRNFGRRIESVERIQGAAGSLEERLAELAEQEGAISGIQARLNELIALLSTDDADEVFDDSEDLSETSSPSDMGIDADTPEALGTAGVR